MFTFKEMYWWIFCVFCFLSTQKLSSQPFSGLTFDTDYMIRVVPFPSLMNESFFPPSFLRTNCEHRVNKNAELLKNFSNWTVFILIFPACEVLLGPDNLVCKPCKSFNVATNKTTCPETKTSHPFLVVFSVWRPKSLNVSQLGSNLHVAFDQAPPTFGFHFYYLYYKLRQDGLFRLQRCKAVRPKGCVGGGGTPGCVFGPSQRPCTETSVSRFNFLFFFSVIPYRLSVMLLSSSV